MTDLFLSVENLHKNFNHKVIFEEVSFSLNKGESMIIQGKSGCGKTTLLRCLAMLEKVDRGRIIFNGKVVSKPRYVDPCATRLEISMVFQQLYLWSHMTVLENISLPLWLRNGNNRQLANKLAHAKLAQLGIENKAYEYPNQLSGGQRQRVALARALVHSPQLLLLDEITASLDPQTTNLVIGIIENIIAAGTSVILVTHSSVNSFMWSYILRFDGRTWKQQKFC